ncbi:NADPH-cytochrome p450 reductase, FAD-binding, alpha-helical domain-3 [Penicillium griseofulvum]|uniref:NADPH--cytochrome P450 reductase n=1 Tax=Penicillium patulum TaxID=5078 RepID=A0A135LCN8_PENPA|nr:NADPH-cytochrome p450 reductase, FAD-binding, alpha-helical domain-3 [Penicillium griseofulvum]KXG46735.1 NADPH-cytochrome p450 reductase, FAD-binding, alpha-helical domain-3 [Penicillium griseofulvum]
MAALPPLNIPPELLQEFSKYGTPTGFADYVALAVLGGIGATYLSKGWLWDKPDPFHHILFERPQLKNGGKAGSANKETRNIAQKLEETGKNIVVFWGSQSGTAEGFAHRLAREISFRWGQETMTADLSDYDPVTISEIPKAKLAIFLVSTYGEGDPSDNTAEFWSWILKARDVSLSNLRYAAFGLGNTNYKFYNRVVDVIIEGLDKFGAQAIIPVGKANDAEGTTEEDFMSWKDDLFRIFKHKLGFQEAGARYIPSLKVEEDESLEPIDLHHGEPNNREAPKAAAKSSTVRTLSISDSRELFKSSNRHCLHMDVDLTNQPELSYKTGDHLAIWPGNPDVEVERLLDVLGISSRRDIPLVIKALDPATKITIPTPTSAVAIFRYYLEIGACVNRDNICDLAQFAPTPEAKAYLLQFGQDKDVYASFISRTHINLGRLLQLACPDKPWDKLPLSYLVETMPHIRPRYYSISSSSMVSPRKPSITAIVSTAPLPQNPNELIHGVTSNYLLALSQQARSKSHPSGITYHLNGPADALQGGKVFAHIRRSNFKLPTVVNTPLIMVAAGTGIAPFRAFLSERCQFLKIGKDVGQMILFFGCRNPNEDYIYREELEEMQVALGDRLRIVTAFSRLEGTPRQYVQDRVAEFGNDVIRLIDEGGTFYVCGRAGMAREVEKVVGQTMKGAKRWSDDEFNGWSKTIKMMDKWQEDVWG